MLAAVNAALEVVRPAIEREAAARVESLEAENLHLRDQAGDMAEELEKAQARVEVLSTMLRAMARRALWRRRLGHGIRTRARNAEDQRDALGAQLRLEVVHCGEFQQRVKELEAILSDNRKMWDESIAQTGAALELNDSAQARVAELTAALTGLLAPGVHGDFIAAAADNARAVLAEGATEDV
jgi:chromosome segregation ATPase